MHKLSATLLLFLLLTNVYSQTSLYDLGTIQTIEITFSQSNWDYQLDTAAAGAEGYIMAKSIKINGTEFDSVGVKYKGNSSYNANQVKNPFHIELDTYKEQDYQGYTDLKLGNGFKDPSFLREVLSYKIVRNYMPAPLSNFANVYVNNTLIGLYSNSESVGKKFVDNRFGSKSNTFIKCNPVNGAGPGTSSLPNLVYLGADSSLYYLRYELESDHGWKDLINLCDTLSNHTAAIENTLNVNQALWMIAFDNVLVNLDSYIGGFAQNYYLYKDDYSRFRPVVWDLNESFGTFSQTGTSNLNTTTAKQQMSHLLHSSDNSWPLIKKLLSVPMYKRMYIAHMRTILAENFGNNLYYNDGLALQELIKTSVNADPNKFFSYTNFLNNLTTDVNIGNGVASGLTNLMNGRVTYLNSQSDFKAVCPEISAVTVSNQSPLIGTQVTVTVTVNNTVSNVYLFYHTNTISPFNRISMFDDGQHGDGIAGDGIFGASLPVIASKTDYYIYAENSQAGIFSPLRAELEFYTLLAAPSVDKGLVINEFLTSNSATMPDQNGEYDDWIELFNHTEQEVSLDSMFLSDSYENPMKWSFPAGTILGAGSYLIVWADEDGDQEGLHANFKLSASGEEIILLHANGEIIDSIAFASQSTDVSMQRCPDDTGTFIAAEPSFAVSNNCELAVTETQYANTITIFPNPFQSYLNITSEELILSSLQLINSTGQVVYSNEGKIDKRVVLDFSYLPSGMYIILLNKTLSRKIFKL